MSQAIAKQAPVRLELRRTNGIDLDGDANDAWSLGRAVQHFFRQRLLLIVVLGIGTLPALIYYAFIAAPIYVSEARFVVRSAASVPGMLSGSYNVASQLSVMARADADTQSVNAYLASRFVVDELIKQDGLLPILARPEGDFWARFPRPYESGTVEELFWRFGDYVDPEFDANTGITYLYVYGFRPEDAQKVALASLKHAEALINRLNDRARQDAVSAAQDVVDKIAARVRHAQDNITAYRNREMVFDPVQEAGAVIQIIAKMSSDLAGLKASLRETAVSSPSSPKYGGIRARIDSLEEQIKKQRALIAGGDSTMAPKIAAYEELMLRRDLEVAAYQSALTTLEQAKQDSQRQQLYLERVAEPNLADYPLYPMRGLSTLAFLGFSLCVYWILNVLGFAAWEHDPLISVTKSSTLPNIRRFQDDI